MRMNLLMKPESDQDSWGCSCRRRFCQPLILSTINRSFWSNFTQKETKMWLFFFNRIFGWSWRGRSLLCVYWCSHSATSVTTAVLFYKQWLPLPAKGSLSNCYIMKACLRYAFRGNCESLLVFCFVQMLTQSADVQLVLPQHIYADEVLYCTHLHNLLISQGSAFCSSGEMKCLPATQTAWILFFSLLVTAPSWPHKHPLLCMTSIKLFGTATSSSIFFIFS